MTIACGRSSASIAAARTISSGAAFRTIRAARSRPPARALTVGDAEPLGHNIIHSVTNPIPRLTGAVHVYGGDFFTAERSEWDAETLVEGRYDAERVMRRFEESNAALR